MLPHTETLSKGIGNYLTNFIETEKVKQNEKTEDVFQRGKKKKKPGKKPNETDK